MAFNAPNIEDEAAYIEFTEKGVNKCTIANHMNDPELFELVKTCQVDAHSKGSWKSNLSEYCFSNGQYFTEKTVIAKPLDSKFCIHKKQNALLRQVKSYIDNNLKPA